MYIDSVATAADTFASKLFDFLEKQPSLTSSNMFISTSNHEDGSAASYIYLLDPVLNGDTGSCSKLSPNNFRDAVEQVMLQIIEFEFWKDNITLCYDIQHDLPISKPELSTLAGLSMNNLKWLFDFCEVLTVGHRELKGDCGPPELHSNEIPDKQNYDKDTSDTEISDTDTPDTEISDTEISDPDTYDTETSYRGTSSSSDYSSFSAAKYFPGSVGVCYVVYVVLMYILRTCICCLV